MLLQMKEKCYLSSVKILIICWIIIKSVIILNSKHLTHSEQQKKCGKKWMFLKSFVMLSTILFVFSKWRRNMSKYEEYEEYLKYFYLIHCEN